MTTLTARRAMRSPLATLACTAAIWCAPQLAHAQSNVLIVLDASGSMAGKIGDQVKMDLAERVVSDMVENMPADMNVGLVVYGARSPRAKNDCKDIELLQPVRPPDVAAFQESLRGLNPRGMTPIGASLERAAEALRGVPGHSTIVLVSDGTETCKSDPCQVARQVHEQTGIDVKVHVVGLDVGGTERSTLECVAQSGGGKYYAVENEQELRSALEEAAEVPPPAPACSRQAAMWMSIGHPGLGEMKNARKGWSGLPKMKFYLGFIPGFGWPGYLQVVSAIDAANCRTNDWPS
jgi:Ca-activated chloride channel family protein